MFRIQKESNMHEFLLRARGIISDIKLPALAVLVVSIIQFASGMNDFVIVLRNPAEPQAITIGQLVKDEISQGQYVSVSGYALYEEAYTMEIDGTIITAYYYLFDSATQHAIVIEADTSNLSSRTSKMAIITGMTEGTFGDLKKLIKRDASALGTEGFKTNSNIYISEGASPPDMLGALWLSIVAGSIAAICLAILLFPTAVFAPRPAKVITGPVYGDDGLKVTGVFLKLKQGPVIKVGRGTRSFTKAAANISRPRNKRLIIHVHHVLRIKSYGMSVAQHATEWVIFLDHDNVSSIEPGILYGWKNRQAVRIQYKQQDKPRTLIVSFERPWGQNLFVKRLRLMGFAVTQMDASTNTE
ncbi:MAG: hypothetical protein GY832_28830 [Chloroflexi bacterium]|nr:hypothetical protein [Chloroflexota bacterium]